MWEVWCGCWHKIFKGGFRYPVTFKKKPVLTTGRSATVTGLPSLCL